jgi:large subunit ribosomal protein L13
MAKKLKSWDKMIIDANNLILGRLGTFAAKKALLGEKIDIINCEGCVITGKKKSVFKKFDRFLRMGVPAKGPFNYKTPERLVKRSIRGMLPYKKDRGIEAFKNIKCYRGVPQTLKGQKYETIKNANIDKVPNLNFVKVNDICIHIGGKNIGGN